MCPIHHRRYSPYTSILVGYIWYTWADVQEMINFCLCVRCACILLLRTLFLFVRTMFISAPSISLLNGQQEVVIGLHWCRKVGSPHNLHKVLLHTFTSDLYGKHIFSMPFCRLKRTFIVCIMSHTPHFFLSFTLNWMWIFFLLGSLLLKLLADMPICMHIKFSQLLKKLFYFFFFFALWVEVSRSGAGAIIIWILRSGPFVNQIIFVYKYSWLHIFDNYPTPNWCSISNTKASQHKFIWLRIFIFSSSIFILKWEDIFGTILLTRIGLMVSAECKQV